MAFDLSLLFLHAQGIKSTQNPSEEVNTVYWRDVVV